jgi:site-specific DNA-methyltransferase (adenine-specific)
MNIIEKRTAEIIPYANNPRNNENAVDAVAASISEFGFKQPIVIDKNNVVVAGHTRLMAAKKLNLETVPCVMADDLTEAQVKAYRLADNKVGELATWDFEKLELEMNDLDMDMEQFGFESIGETSEEQIEEDEVPDVPEEPTAKVGDLYQLGEHRLICGDSTDTNVIEKLMNKTTAELLLTDPPYGIDVVAVNKTIGGDKPFGNRGKVGG